MAAAEELVTRIFREVVDRGNEAITQAEDVADEDEEVGWRMLKAGQALVKEGERANKRLRPLLEGRDTDVYDAIRKMMVQNEEILEKQRALDSMLYDFDDYMEIDSFEPEKFTELQSEAKALALLLMESIRKVIADPVTPKAAQTSTMPPPAPRPTAFPPLPPLPPNAPAVRPESRSSKHSSVQSAVRPSTGKERPPVSPWQKSMPPKLARSRSGSAGHNGLPSPTSGQEYRPTALRPPPSPQPSQRLSDGESGKFDFGLNNNRAPAPQLSHRPSHTDLARENLAKENLAREHLVRDTYARDSYGKDNYARDNFAREAPERAHPERMSRLADTLRIPAEKKYTPPADPLQTSFLDNETYNDSPTTTYNDRRFTATSSDRQSSNFDATSPHHSNSNRTSAFSNATSYTSPTRLSNQAFNNGIPRSSSIQKPGELREKHIQSLSEQASGLMLVEEWQSTHTSTTHDTSATGYPSWRRVDKSLGVESTFIAMKGFCKGALLFKESGPGEGVKKLGGAGDAAAATQFSQNLANGGAFSSKVQFQDTMAQCTRCEYTHKYAQLMQDLDKDPIAALQSHGLRYRKRFLYKSHMPTKIMTKAYYACPFCAQTGSTPREGDATVFTSSTQLLRHVARHPQPLPDLPGLTILYGTLAPEDLTANDFDLHFPSPPAAPGGPPESDMAKTSLLPSVTAVKDHVQLPGEKPLDRPEKTTTTPLLEFFCGARVVGVEFPEQWGGKWCTGWHDGDFGAFPARSIQLDAPRRGKIPSQAAPVSRRSCVTRWKWDARGGAGTGWLALEKGETISNLEWDDPDAWYWIGTNKKGKWGIFPNSHVKMDSVKDAALESASSSVTKSKKSILPW